MPEYEVSKPEELEQALAAAPRQDVQVHVCASDGSSLSAFFVGEHAWLMYLRHFGDSGFSSRNPEYCGDPEAVFEFTLDNGQVDEFEASWFYPRAKVEGTLRWFCEHQRQPPDITWYED
jgi:hypothetical protein